MPKFQKSRISLLKSWIKDDFNFIIDKNNENSIYYQTCNKSVKCDQKSQLVQHVNTSMYKRKSDEADATSKGKFRTSNKFKKNEFYSDLTKTMVAVNIP